MALPIERISPLLFCLFSRRPFARRFVETKLEATCVLKLIIARNDPYISEKTNLLLLFNASLLHLGGLQTISELETSGKRVYSELRIFTAARNIAWFGSNIDTYPFGLLKVRSTLHRLALEQALCTSGCQYSLNSDHVELLVEQLQQ